MSFIRIKFIWLSYLYETIKLVFISILQITSNCVSIAKLYGDLPRVSFKVRQKRLRLSGHVIRHPELPLSKVILWKPVHGHRGRVRPRATFVGNLLIDTGVKITGELETLMLDIMVWRRVIQDPRAAPAGPP